MQSVEGGARHTVGIGEILNELIKGQRLSGQVGHLPETGSSPGSGWELSMLVGQ